MACPHTSHCDLGVDKHKLIQNDSLNFQTAYSSSTTDCFAAMTTGEISFDERRELDSIS